MCTMRLSITTTTYRIYGLTILVSRGQTAIDFSISARGAYTESDSALYKKAIWPRETNTIYAHKFAG